MSGYDLRIMMDATITPPKMNSEGWTGPKVKGDTIFYAETAWQLTGIFFDFGRSDRTKLLYSNGYPSIIQVQAGDIWPLLKAIDSAEGLMHYVGLIDGKWQRAPYNAVKDFEKMALPDDTPLVVTAWDSS